MSETVPAGIAAPIRATLADLPPAAAAAIRAARAVPEGGIRRTIPAAGIRFSTLQWGEPDGRPLLLLHGVTSSARTFWRLGPALAAVGYRAIAPDLPGHGSTAGGADGRGFAFDDTARVVVAFAGAAFAGRHGADLAVVGHSWGSMLAARLPAAGLRPARIVLVDPPVMDGAALRAMADDPSERPDASPDGALATIRAEHPDWPEGEQVVKAESLTQVVAEAAIAVLLGNGDWDASLTALADPAASGVDLWVVRGEDATGSLTPASWLPRLVERVGAGHVLTVEDGPHSPQRTHIEATTLALLRALGDEPLPRR
jgi:pimeloyl-ACP methyl ester carboxylesterase